MLTSLLLIPLAVNILLAPPSINPGVASEHALGQGQQVQTQVERKATIEARLTLIRQERIRSFFGRMVTRLEALIARLDRLITRMQARIDKIEEAEEDIDTAQAQEDITEAKGLLEKAKALLEGAEDLLDEILKSDTPREDFKEAIDLVQEIKGNLIEIHRLLVQAIGSIKGLRVGSPTPTPTPNP